MGARYLKLDELRADRLADAVRTNLPTQETPALTPAQLQELARQANLL